MIVPDASVVVAALLAEGADGDEARDVLLGEEAHAPHLLDLEVSSVLRRFLLSRRLAPESAPDVLTALRDLPVVRHGHDLLLERALQLRDSATVYDASYVALAELLDATFVTGDRRLARAPGLRCEVRVVG